MGYAPVVLFCYKRIDTLTQVVEALKLNVLAPETELFIFSDAPKRDSDFLAVAAVRDYIKNVNGFKTVTVIEAVKNKGLANSIIDGVSQVIKKYGKVIVLEDDLITSSNFLIFMNSALGYYRDNEHVFSIAGYTAVIKNPAHDVYFTLRGSSWGWATWQDRWETTDWDIKNYGLESRSFSWKRKFNLMGSDLSKMLNDQKKGKIDSWAIRWVYNQFLMNKFTVYPTLSKIQNIGNASGATNTKDSFGRYKTDLDYSVKKEFQFVKIAALNPYYSKQFLKQFSIKTRIKYKLLNFFSK